MATAPEHIQLTPEQRQRIARLADELGRSWDDVLAEALTFAENRRRAKALPGENAYDALVRLGFLGSVEGPADLSVNPKYVEGFGLSPR